MLNVTQTMTCGAATLTLPAPRPGYQPDYERAQALDRNAAGEVYVYDKAIGFHGVAVIVTLTAAQKNALATFFENSTQGAVNTFTWVDHRGHTYAGCRFRTRKLQFSKTPGQRYQVALEIITPDTVL